MTLISAVRWTEYQTPDVYRDEIGETAFVPTRSAATESQAFEHLLTDLTDWSWREDARDEIRADWKYRGVRTIELCEHPLDEPHERRYSASCRFSLPCHWFELDPPLSPRSMGDDQ